LKQCPNCRGNLADFVSVCPYCGVATPVAQAATSYPVWEIAPKSSGLALASLICGVLFLFVPAAIAAVVLGHIALVTIKRSAGRLAGQGMAIAGLVMGYLGIGITALFTIAVIFAMRTAFRQNVPANETAAIDTMRTYEGALKAYAAMCPEQGYPVDLERLGPGSGDCMHANLIDVRLAIQTPVRYGYQFSYNSGAHGMEKVSAFALIARPVVPNATGQRYFYLDEGGIIRQSKTQIVGPKSAPVDDSKTGQDDKDHDQDVDPG